MFLRKKRRGMGVGLIITGRDKNLWVLSDRRVRRVNVRDFFEGMEGRNKKFVKGLLGTEGLGSKYSGGGIVGQPSYF